MNGIESDAKVKFDSNQNIFEDIFSWLPGFLILITVDSSNFQ